MELKWNECHYIDCLEGMKQLKDKSFDLCLTDPPYVDDFKAKATTSKKLDFQINEISSNWLADAMRVCKSVVFTPGFKNFYIYPPARMMACWYKGGTMSRNLTGGISNWEPVLVYGEATLDTDYFYYSIQKARMNEYKDLLFIHPCPKPRHLYEQIIEHIKPHPKTILDPFLGSGTVADVAIRRGIEWMGFEIETAYRADIDKRIERAKMEKSRMTKRMF